MTTAPNDCDQIIWTTSFACESCGTVRNAGEAKFMVQRLVCDQIGGRCDDAFASQIVGREI